jgi:hypothetical protein
MPCIGHETRGSSAAEVWGVLIMQKAPERRIIKQVDTSKIFSRTSLVSIKGATNNASVTVLRSDSY